VRLGTSEPHRTRRCAENCAMATPQKITIQRTKKSIW
jgi:hypothetical protein